MHHFPVQLKIANTAPVFKGKDPFDKTNYRTVSILPLLSKVYEKSRFKQLSVYSNKLPESNIM